MSGFAQALPIVLSAEGGYSSDPRDRGGETNFGVTQATYHEWLDSIGERRRPVRDITPEEVERVYHARYWLAAKCDALPWPVSAAHFDAAVNHGVGRAVRMLQEVLGVAIDGVFGPVTMAAAEGVDPGELVNDLLWIRIAFYQRISRGDQVAFLRGWLARILELRKGLR